MKLAQLSSLTLLLACGTSVPSAPSAPEVAQPAVANVPTAPTAPITAPSNAAPSRCGDGKITFYVGDHRYNKTYVLYCKDNGMPSIRYELDDRSGEREATKEVTLAVWNQAWELAEKHQWSTVRPSCKLTRDGEVSGELPEQAELTVFKGGQRLKLACDAKLPVAWHELAQVLVAASPSVGRAR